MFSDMTNDEFAAEISWVATESPRRGPPRFWGGIPTWCQRDILIPATANGRFCTTPRIMRILAVGIGSVTAPMAKRTSPSNCPKLVRFQSALKPQVSNI